MEYQVYLRANIESKLTAKELESRLVLALYDADTNYSKIDNTDEDLEVLEYHDTEVLEV